MEFHDTTVTMRGAHPLTGQPWEQEVSAQGLGLLAVHPSRDGDAWVVSHVPTGYYIAMTPNMDVAYEIVATLHVLDWDFTEPRKLPAPTRAECRRYIGALQESNPDLIATVGKQRNVR
jgi:hypothetical protein